MGLFTRTPSLTGQEAVELVRSGAALVDVREKSEWNAGHAPQATHIPLVEVSQADRRLPTAKQIVVVCRSGNRSRSATKALRQMGLDAINLRGGMRAWQAAGGSVVDRRNRPGVIA